MKLDYRNGVYLLTGGGVTLPGQREDFMRDHGLDYSIPLDALFTKEPYCAATFHRYATQAAASGLAGIVEQIASSRALEGPSIKCPSGEELSGYQRATVGYALARTNTLIADDPGTGKTAEAVCFCNETGAKKVLVQCPAAVRGQWPDEIRRWTTMKWPYQIHVIAIGKDGVNPQANWTVVSYDLAKTVGIGSQLAKEHYDVIIFDEIHQLKENTSARSRANFGGGKDQKFPAIASRGTRLLGLSGTPMPNRPREGYTVARHFCFDAIDWLSEDRFRERFNPSATRTGEREDGTRYTYIDERTGRHAELQNRFRGNFMARHLKRDVLDQLKLPVYDLVRVEPTGAVRAALSAEKLLDIDPDLLTGQHLSFGGDVSTVRRQMGEAIAPEVVPYAEMLLIGGVEKLVIFAWHHSVMDILEKGLHKYGTVRIDGATTGPRRIRLKDSFITDPKKRVLLGQMLACGVGMDGLQHVASHALVAEPSWVPGENIQAIDRLDRRGQKRSVKADIFVAPESFSERLLAKSLHKAHVLHSTLDRQL